MPVKKVFTQENHSSDRLEVKGGGGVVIISINAKTDFVLANADIPTFIHEVIRNCREEDLQEIRSYFNQVVIRD
jgi:translation elongation factor EF-Ts